mmetsp:Transcript_49099/g.129800  ORF Transcript_49099/g.129800 Transcript_49099/m.129800 type:complete len:230 (+) Transcript_49099:230-919(+)
MLSMHWMTLWSSSAAICRRASLLATSSIIWTTRHPCASRDLLVRSLCSSATRAFFWSAVPTSRSFCTTWLPHALTDSLQASGSSASKTACLSAGAAPSSSALRNWQPFESCAAARTLGKTSRSEAAYGASCARATFPAAPPLQLRSPSRSDGEDGSCCAPFLFPRLLVFCPTSFPAALPLPDFCRLTLTRPAASLADSGKALPMPYIGGIIIPGCPPPMPYNHGGYIPG